MANVLDEDYTNQNIDLSQYNFRGKLAGKSWKKDEALSRLKMARSIIFIMSLIVFYPVLMEYINFGSFEFAWFLERLVFSIILILCGIFYNKFRLASLIIALLPISLILYTNIIYLGYFPIRVIGFNLAVFTLILVGIYFHFQEIKLRKLLILEIRKDNPEAVKI